MEAIVGLFYSLRFGGLFLQLGSCIWAVVLRVGFDSVSGGFGGFLASVDGVRHWNIALLLRLILSLSCEIHSAWSHSTQLLYLLFDQL